MIQVKVLGMFGGCLDCCRGLPYQFFGVDCYQGLRLDQDQRFRATPIFWQPPSVFTPASWQNAGGEILRQIFGVPILAEPS
jgi:hypothetical protein